MAFGFPLFVDVVDNNCLVIGGGSVAAEKAQVFLLFGAKVTVISPSLCPALQQLDAEGKIRYIPRRYFRGDCANAFLCVAATDSDSLNISIAQECKSRKIPVYVSSPEVYGSFRFPNVVHTRSVTLAMSDSLNPAVSQNLCRQLAQALPAMLDNADKQK